MRKWLDIYLSELAKTDSKVRLLIADVGDFPCFSKEHPDKFINVGVSEEFCFILKDNNFQMWTDKCDELEKWANPEVNPEDITPEKNEEHGAAGCIGMDLAGVTHTVDSKNVVTLKWTTVWDPNSNVEIAIFNPNEESSGTSTP